MRFVAALALAGLAACTTAPVQEMSDARQALQAAEQVHAQQQAAGLYGLAQRQLEQAETALRNNEYGAARRHARHAKENAVKARVVSLKAPR